MPREASLSPEEIVRAAASHCQQSILYLLRQYNTNPKVPKTLERVAAGIQELPPAYSPQTNPWKLSSGAVLLKKMLVFFPKWCTNLPHINGTTNQTIPSLKLLDNPLQCNTVLDPPEPGAVLGRGGGEVSRAVCGGNWAVLRLEA